MIMSDVTKVRASCSQGALLLVVSIATGFCACPVGRAQDDGPKAPCDARLDYLRTVVEGFWKHERWRTNKLIQSWLGGEQAGQGSGRITDSPRKRAAGALRLVFRLRAGAEDDEAPPEVGVCWVNGSFEIIFHGVALFPESERDIPKETVRVLASIFADMGVLRSAPDGEVRDREVVVGDRWACFLTYEGWVRFEAKWGDPPYGKAVGNRKLTVDFRSVYQPREPLERELEKKLLRELRHFDKLTTQAILASRGEYDPAPGLTSEDPDERIKAALSLWMGAWWNHRLQPKYAMPLIDAIRKEKDTSVVPFLLLPLDFAADESVAERLVELIETGEEQTANLAAASLLRATSGRLGEWYEARQEELGDDVNRRLRQAAVRALSAGSAGERTRASGVLLRGGVDGDADAIRALVKAIKEEPHPHCAPELFYPFAHSQGMQVFETLVSLLNDDRPEVWENALKWIASKPAWRETWHARREKFTGEVRFRAFLERGVKPCFSSELRRAPKKAFNFLASLVNQETCDRTGAYIVSLAWRELTEYGDPEAIPVFLQALHEFREAGTIKRPGSMAAHILLGLNKLTGHNYGGLDEEPGSLQWLRATKTLDWDAVFEELRRDFLQKGTLRDVP